MWVFFSAAIVEAYVQGCKSRPRSRGFWFYGCAIVILFTTILALITFLFNRVIPPFSMTFSVLLACITAVAFFSLSYGILFPGKPSQPASTTGNYPVTQLEEVFRKHRLSRRETEIARLMVEKGLNSEGIAELIFIAPVTVKNHITNIYKKCNVNNRAEFMALFIPLYSSLLN